MNTENKPNLIEQAVAPLKERAVAAAGEYAVKVIARVKTDLEANNWDANVVAPYPNARMGGFQYNEAVAKYRLYREVTTVEPVGRPLCRRPSDPDYRKPSLEAEQKFIAQAKEDAAAQFEAYVCKLVKKIGLVDAAHLEDTYSLWRYSVLVVVKGELTERWKTQQIINTSCHGKVFNQWPTRKIKG